MRRGFAQALNLTLTPAAPTDAELRRTRDLMAGKQAEMS
jgi:hypothetical protein